MGDRVTLAAIPRAAPTTIRGELADALDAVLPAGVYGVAASPVAQISFPAFVLAPGVPFSTPSLGANGAALGIPRRYDFRFVWFAVVGRLVTDALDELEAMGALVAASLEGIDGASYMGCPVPIQVDQLAGVDCYTAQHELAVKRAMT